MDEEKVEAIGEALRTEDHRERAIGIVADIDPLPEYLVEAWIDDLGFALEAENYPFTQYEILETLERIAEKYPEKCATVARIVAQELNKELRSLYEADLSSDRKVELATSTLSSVVGRIDPEDTFPRIDPDEIDQLLEYGDVQRRSLAYRLLGASANPRAVEELVDEPSYELDPVLESRETALQNAERVILRSLSGGGRLSTLDAISSFSELYAGGVTTESEMKDRLGNVSFDSDGGESTDLTRVLLDIEQIADRDEHAAQVFADEAIRLLEGNFKRHDNAWEILEAIARGAPNVVVHRVLGLLEKDMDRYGDAWDTLEEISHIFGPPIADHSERLGELVKDAEPPTLSAALDVLSQVRKGTATEAYRVIASEVFTLVETDIENEEAWEMLVEIGRGDPRVMADHSERLGELVKDAEPRVFSAALDALSHIPEGTATEAYRVIANEVFTLLEADVEDEDAWEMLSRIANRSPQTVVQRSQRLITLVDEGDRTEWRQGLDIVTTIGQRRSSLPVDLGKLVLRGLDSDDEAVVRTAIDAVMIAGFYPPPERLERLAEGETEIAREASEALDDLSSRWDEVPSSLARALRVDRSGVALFDGSDGAVYLKRRSAGGLWEDVNVGEIRQTTIEAVVEHVGRDENVPAVLPHYEPRDIVLIAIAIVTSDLEEERQVGVFSPGSRTHWGMKGQIREELERFAISEVPGTVIQAHPIPGIVPHAYVWDEELKDDSDGDGPGRLILCKKVDDLRHVDDVDVVLSNLTGRTRENTRRQLENIEETHPEATFVDTFSYYVKNERDGRPRYGPPLGLESTATVPGLEAIETVLGDDGSHEESRSSDADPRRADVAHDTSADVRGRRNWSVGDDDVRALATPASIEMEHVEAEEISSLLDQVFEKSARLRGVEDGGAGGMIFSRQLFFERLPVPGEDFDEWVRERYYEGERFVPPLIEERIEDVDRRAGSVEKMQAIQPLNESVRLFQQIARRLEEHNPLFDALKRHVDDAKDDDRRLAILSESTKHAEILRCSLVKREVVTRDELDSGVVSVVSPDEARRLPPTDELVVFGALHQENAGFYLHPRVDETVVLTYDRTWATMVERHAREFVDILNGVVAGADYSPYAYPELTGDTEPEPVSEEETPTVDTPDSEAPPQRTDSRSESIQNSAGSTSTSPGSTSRTAILADAMESVSTREYREESGRYEREVRHYVLETASGAQLELTNHDRILRERTSGDQLEYHWVSPEALTADDTIATIPDALKTDLWQEQLRELYEEEIDSGQAVDRLNEWYEAVETIWGQIRDDVSVGDSVADSMVHETVYDRVTESDDDFSRAEATVRTWFDSVLDAEGPLDLVEKPSLTIGPRSYLDIEAIGLAFEHETLAADAREIEAAMEGLRTINRRQGHELHDHIREQMNEAQSTRVSEAATHYTVEEVEEVSEDSDSKRSDRDG